MMNISDKYLSFILFIIFDPIMLPTIPPIPHKIPIFQSTFPEFL